MLPVIPIAAVPFAIAVLLTLILRHRQRTTGARFEAAARRLLEQTGLALSGNPMGSYTLRGRAFDVDLVLENGPQIGPNQSSVTVTMVRFSASLADMSVCRTNDADASLPRAQTGHAGFDSRYAGLRTPSGYRGDGRPAAAGDWTQDAILARIMELGLEWIQVRDGNVELALTRLGADDIDRALAVAANIARASRNEPLVDVRPGPRTYPPVERVVYFKLQWGVALVLGLILGTVASYFEPLRTLDQAAVCGAGATLLHTESDGDDGGTSHDFHCSNNQDSVLILVHLAGCVMLMVGVLALAIVTVSAVRNRQTR